MRCIMKIILCAVLISCNLLATEIQGSLTNLKKISDWTQEKHFAILEAYFPERNLSKSFTLELEFSQIAQFRANPDDLVTIMQELPGSLVGDSLFVLQIAGYETAFEAQAKSLDLTKADWGLSLDEMMITEVSLPNITLNGTDVIQIEDPSGPLLGAIVHFSGQEQFNPDEPGYSIFEYVSLDGGSRFTMQSHSINSLWAPSEEQLNQMLIVYKLGQHRTWHGLLTVGVHLRSYNGKEVYIRTSNESSGPIPYWTKVGNRFIPIREGLYVDLDTRLVITDHPIRAF